MATKATANQTTKEIADALAAVELATAEAVPFSTTEQNEALPLIAAQVLALEAERDGSEAGSPTARRQIAIDMEITALNQERTLMEAEVAHRTPLYGQHLQVVREAREDLRIAEQAAYDAATAADGERLEQLVLEAFELVHAMDAKRLAAHDANRSGIVDPRLIVAHRHLISAGADLEMLRTRETTSPAIWNQRQQERLEID